MSREILFRGFHECENGEKVIIIDGKQIKGEWVEGNLFVADDGKCQILIGYINYRIAYDVIPETVGQYTGLTDKNGIRIFEGYIVKLTDTKANIEWYAVIEFGNPNGNYDWGWQLKPIKKVAVNTDILCWVDMEEIGAYCEIIGNIYDNSELLKENDNE